MDRPFRRIAVVGAGAMGRGIAQLFAQSGFDVVVHDTRGEAIDAALAHLKSTFERLAERGKISAEQARENLAHVIRGDSLDSLADCDLVIEAIIERLDVKQALFAQLEAVCAADAVLATNTSSLSVTAIASTCKHPGRIAGYHFFNPVPLMKVVEVVRGAATDEAPVERLVELARIAGHRAVVARDYPGFIVNHAGRAYGPESIRAVSEGVADTVTVDRILREQVSFDGKGFKLGPFELLDLTGLDVSHPVMESIYRQFYDEPRFRPSVLTAQHYAAGWFGRKTGIGFYRHEGGTQRTPEESPHPEPAHMPRVWVAPGPAAAALGELVEALGAATAAGATPPDDAMILVAPLGIDATTAAAGFDAGRVVAIDTLFPYGHRACKRRVLMGTPATTPATLAAAAALFARDGARTSILRDSAGFIAQRVVAMIVSVAADIAQQRIASPADIDEAVRIGLGYPVGPLTMGDRIGPATVVEILRGMARVTGDPRCRPSLWLQRRAQLGLSLLHEDNA
ncbi:MAG: 3-hydroxyacyl-CoA dehydrogenase [Pseudomonadota bacterium]|nr:3-hydroxyacyl-CoA dehydrogenase [Pseudomonadota bacterium]